MCVCVFQSEAGDVCYCCSLSPSSNCPEEKLLELHPAHSCSTMRILLKVACELMSEHTLSRNIYLIHLHLQYMHRGCAVVVLLQPVTLPAKYSYSVFSFIWPEVFLIMTEPYLPYVR